MPGAGLHGVSEALDHLDSLLISGPRAQVIHGHQDTLWRPRTFHPSPFRGPQWSKQKSHHPWWAAVEKCESRVDKNTGQASHDFKTVSTKNWPKCTWDV